MPRRPSFVGEFVYHVINRAATRMRLFETSQDYLAVQQLLFDVRTTTGIRLLAYCIMRNPLRASLVQRAEDWRWSSCWLRQHQEAEGVLEPWPVARPDNWLDILNAVEDPADLESIRTAVIRGRPLGEPTWVATTAKIIGIDSHLRRPGRPMTRRTSENPSRPLFLPDT
jgi:hypothetical protein